MALAAVALSALVVAVRQNLQAGIAHRPEREIGVVEIYDVRVVVVDKLDGAVVDFVAESLVGRCDAVFLPVPRTVVFAQRVALLIELLRVKAIPPCACSILLRQHAVVRHSGQRALGVGSPGRFIPYPRVGCMHAHSEAQPIFAAGLCPSTHDIFLRSEGDRVPALIFAVVKVEVVVVVGQSEEIAGSGFFVKLHQSVGVPVLRFPLMNPVLEAPAARMVARVDVVFVLAAALDVHVAGVPVTVLRLALRPPVGPDTELGVAEPFRALPCRQALHSGLPLARRNRLFRSIYNNFELWVRVGSAVLRSSRNTQRRRKQ